MMRTSIRLIAIPVDEGKAERLDLSVLISRALKIESRMKKGVNQEDEFRRYQILCDRIEYLGSIFSQDEKLASADLGPEYFEMLLTIQQMYPEESRKSRATANFCPAGDVEKAITAFESLVKRAGFSQRPEVSLKIDFYREAGKQNKHVLELHELIFEEQVEDTATDGLMTEFLSMPVRDDITSTKEINSFIALEMQISKVISDIDKGIQSGVSFSDISHNVITETLHKFVFKSAKPMYLPVIYADGTKARPFPIHCLKIRDAQALQQLDKYPILKVGMISGRHHEMDENMHIYMFRNQEISTGKTAAETDEAAYQKAKEIFEKMRREGVCRISFCQTGFQPVIVGFYRALVEEIIKRKEKSPTIEVTPLYYFGAETEKGRKWV